MRTCVTAVSLTGLLIASAAYAEVGISLKTLDWDKRQPDKVPYQERRLDAFIDTAVSGAWNKARVRVVNDVQAAVTKPDMIASGITLYNVTLTLNPNPPQPSLVATGPTTGTIKLLIPGNRMDFTSTHPLSRGKFMDPRMATVFDLVVNIDFRLNGKASPPLEIVKAVAQPVNTVAIPVNMPAAFGVSFDDLVKSIFGGRRLQDQITSGINQSALPVTNDLRAYMRDNATLLAFPQGYGFNGGRVEGNRIVLAAARLVPLTPKNLPIVARWDSALGRAIPNCGELGVTVTLPYLPPPYGEGKYISSQPPANFTSAASESPSGFWCDQSFPVFEGVTVDVQYKSTLSPKPDPHKPGVYSQLIATPVNWQNPVLIGGPQNAPQFRLDRKTGQQDGYKERNASQYERMNPIDPIAKQRLNPAAPVQQAAPRTGTADRWSTQPGPVLNKDTVTAPHLQMNPAVKTPVQGQVPSALR